MMRNVHWSVRLLGLALIASGITIAISGEVSTEIFVTSFGADLALVAVLALASRGVPWRFKSRAAVLFVLFFGAMILNIAIDITFFTTMSLLERMTFLVGGAVLGVCYAVAVGWLFSPETEGRLAKVDLMEHLRGRNSFGWGWRVVASVFCYLVLYLFVGAFAYQFTKPYYTDPSYGLNLTVPSLTTVLLVQCARAPIYLLSLWPFLAGTSYTRGKSALVAGSALFVLGGLAPLLSNTNWPATLRFYHTIEILFQNAPAGFVMAWLLGKVSKQNELEMGASQPVTL